MFTQLIHLRNSVCRFREDQLGRSCVRWLCKSLPRSLDDTNRACHLPSKAGITVTQEAIIKRKRKGRQRSRAELAAHRYDLLKSALLRYKEEYGDMLVPSLFVIPRDDESWPKELRGRKLGATVTGIRVGTIFKDKEKDLTSLGFDYSSQLTRHGYAVVASALLIYKEINGDMKIPRIFIVPKYDKSWPKDLWDMKLGKTVSDIRNGNSYKDDREKLISIGFDYSPQQTRYKYNVIELALVRYKEKYGDFQVPSKFVISRDDESWPEETWGLKLGMTAYDIKRGQTYKYKKDALLSIGLDYNIRRTRIESGGETGTVFKLP